MRTQISSEATSLVSTSGIITLERKHGISFKSYVVSVENGTVSFEKPILIPTHHVEE